jgi:uncharacterized membrane protein YcjF (UPF0283 family)
VERATERVSKDLLQSQNVAYIQIQENFEKQNNYVQKFHKVQAFTFFALSVIAIVLFIALIARTLALGVWEGLFLEQLWNLGDWYWSVLAIVILVGIIVGVVFLIIKGMKSLRY